MKAVDFIKAKADKQTALRIMRKFEKADKWPETKRAATLADKIDARAGKMIRRED